MIHRELSDARFKTGISKILLMALPTNSRAHTGTPLQAEAVNLARTPLLAASIELLRKCTSLVHGYEALVEQTQRNAKPKDLSDRFSIDRGRTIRVIKAGKKITHDQISQLLEGPGNERRRQRAEETEEAVEESADVKAMLQAGLKTLKSPDQVAVENWGFVAHDMIMTLNDLADVAKRH